MFERAEQSHSRLKVRESTLEKIGAVPVTLQSVSHMRVGRARWTYSATNFELVIDGSIVEGSYSGAWISPDSTRRNRRASTMEVDLNPLLWSAEEGQKISGGRSGSIESDLPSVRMKKQFSRMERK